MSVTAAEAIANYQSNPSIAPQMVIDSAANVAANLDGLETLASANDIVSISLTDTGTPTLRSPRLRPPMTRLRWRRLLRRLRSRRPGRSTWQPPPAFHQHLRRT